MFSIIIPTWNNLPFLKLCVESIRAYTKVETQVIVHVNQGTDGTLEWVKQQEIDFTYTLHNSGVCVAVNQAASKAVYNYIVFMNDDMFVLPGWDLALADDIKRLDTDLFMLSATMIEPLATNNPCVIVANFGRDETSFNKEELLRAYAGLPKNDWSGSTWPPTVVHKKWWDAVGGYSEEFSPGMASDDDFAMKMWSAGCRIFKGVAGSRVYHFISKSTGRVVRNNGRKQFLQKWNIKQSTFHKYYLHRGQPYKGKLHEPSTLNPGLLLNKLSGKIQRML